MKRTIAITVFSLLALSCETEESAVSTSPQNNLSENSTLVSKLRQVSQSPTAVDDFIDGSNCFAIQFPYSVAVDGQTVVLDSDADYEQVRELANGSATGGEISINFPVNVVYADYSEATFATQTAFDSAKTGCTGSTELSCMGIAFPLGIFTYDSNNQLAESFDIGSNEALFELLADIESYDALAFEFPITFNTTDGSVTIESNQQLEAAIDSYTDDCLALLNPGPQPTVSDYLTDGTWYVSYFFNYSEQTAMYQDYDFTFNDNGTVQVTGPDSDSGTWDISSTGEQAQFSFVGSMLDALEGTWTITNATETLIEMHRESTGVDPEKFLTLSKN
ncbi:hypothetical protein OGH69_11965 [Flavobacterium sp. MFBS3-15]|uniref:hypothetical protein n=1 Tax=Flavobacterium sp. MFBS3-15 TaxID=2989816 RepID=UPI002235DBCF|nr:hypothetical protein [Flavobacterium sp. MFBS3-15]MCW4469687.1 hypothetical protein [Flavobacterium sp. MFBS3-15]